LANELLRLAASEAQRQIGEDWIVLHEAYRQFKHIKKTTITNALNNKYTFVEFTMLANPEYLENNVFCKIPDRFLYSIENYSPSKLWVYSRLKLEGVHLNIPLENEVTLGIHYSIISNINSDIMTDARFVLNGMEVDISNKLCFNCSHAISCLTEGVKHFLYPGCKYDLQDYNGIPCNILLYKVKED